MLFIIAPMLVGITVILFFYALAAPNTDALQERLKAYGYDAKAGGGVDLTQSFAQRVFTPISNWLMATVRSLTPSEIVPRANDRLKQAGQPMSVGAYLAFRIVIMVLLPLAASLPAIISGNFGLFQLLMAILLFWIGSKLTDIWLSFRIDDRVNKIRRALPDALDLITVCVEAGYGLEAAIAKVSERTSGPLQDEFNVALAEIRLGKPRQNALRDLSQRIALPELQSFIAAILQADQMGVSIADVLRVQADAMRIRRRQRAEEIAAQLPIKMLFPLFLLIFPSLMIIVLAPAFINIFDFFGKMGV